VGFLRRWEWWARFCDAWFGKLENSAIVTGLCGRTHGDKPLTAEVAEEAAEDAEGEARSEKSWRDRDGSDMKVR